MVKRSFSQTLIILIILVSITSAAPQVGFGGSIHIEPAYLFEIYDYGDLVYLGIGMTPTIRMPIVISDGFSVEPEFGIWHSMDKYESDNSDYKRIGNFGIYTLNVYFKFTKRLNSMLLYPGIRLGIQYAESKVKRTGEGYDDDPYISADRNQVLGLLYGGEYFFNSNFSLGGEAQINYTLIDKNENSSSSLITTSANFIFRWYL